MKSNIYVYKNFMKHSIYFKSQEELQTYFPDGVPNNFLAIVEDEDKTVLFSSTNNIDGTGESIGGYVDNPETIAELSYATTKSETILVGDSQSTIVVED